MVRKRTVIIVTTALLALMLVLSGCGIARELYDGSVADKEQIELQTSEVRSQIQDMENQKTEMAAQIAEQEAAYVSMEQELAGLEAENGNLQSAIDSAETRLKEKQETLAGIEAENAAYVERLPDVDYATYENTDAGFSMNHPETWTFETIDESGAITYVFEDKAAGISLSVWSEDAGGLPTRDYYEAYLEAIETEYGTNFLFVGETPDMIGGQLGIQGSYTLKVNGAYENIYVISVIVKSGKVWNLLLACEWDDFSETAFLFSEVINSFKLL